MASLRFPPPMKKAPSRHRTRLSLELLEGRCLPSTVTNLTDHDPGSLRDAIASTPAGDRVDFQPGLSGTITLTSETLIIANDLSIVGPGSDVITVSGNKAFQVFTIAPAVTVTVSGLTIADGTSRLFGGGISNDGTLTIRDSAISGNRSGNRGGGIYNGPAGTLAIVNSNLSGNSTPNAGGAIYNVGTLTLSSTTLSGNGSMTADGGAVFNVGTLTANNCTFSGNGGKLAYGGAIRSDGALTVDGDTFSGNTGSYGGAVYNVGTATVSNARISRNSSGVGYFVGGYGGGIFNQAMLTVSNCTISNNDSGFGGGMYNSGSLVISSCILTGNSTAGVGGGLMNLGTATINSSTIIYNGTPYGPGGGIFSRGMLTIDHSTVSDNGAGTAGGGISNDGRLTVSYCTIANNRAHDGSGGGILSYSTLTIDNTTISGNSAYYDGSAISGPRLNLSNSIISGNSVVHTSESVIHTSSATISNCTISDNKRGGNIYGNGTISNSVITRNSSSQPGGGLEGQWTVDGCTISDNEGGLEAGGFYGSGSISNSTITGNRGNAGGGIVANGTLTISNSTISANIARKYGPYRYAGAIHAEISGQTAVTLVNCTISGNTVESFDQSGAQLVIEHYGTTGKSILELRNTIVSGDGSKPNFLTGNGGMFVSLGHNLTSDDGGGFLTSPDDLINVNPLLGPLQDNGGPTKTMALRLGSPAIDAGDNTDAPDFDQRGPNFLRIVGGVIDIGAFEVQPGPATRFQISTPAQVTSNEPFDVIVTALDAYGHIAAGYLGMVTFRSSDSDAGVMLPADYTFTVPDGGVHTFLAGVILVTPGDQTLTVTDANGLSGTAMIQVTAPAPPPAGGGSQSETGLGAEMTVDLFWEAMGAARLKDR